MLSPDRPPLGGRLRSMSKEGVLSALGDRLGVRTPIWYVADLFIGFRDVLLAVIEEGAGPKTKEALYKLCRILFFVEGRGAQRFNIRPEDVDFSFLAPSSDGSAVPLPQVEVRVVSVRPDAKPSTKRERTLWRPALVLSNRDDVWGVLDSTLPLRGFKS